MYETIPGKGSVPCTVSGACLLPNTHGNSLLTVVAITAITVGVAIMASTVVRFVLKRAYRA